MAYFKSQNHYPPVTKERVNSRDLKALKLYIEENSEFVEMAEAEELIALGFNFVDIEAVTGKQLDPNLDMRAAKLESLGLSKQEVAYFCDDNERKVESDNKQRKMALDVLVNPKTGELANTYELRREYGSLNTARKQGFKSRPLPRPNAMMLIRLLRNWLEGQKLLWVNDGLGQFAGVSLYRVKKIGKGKTRSIWAECSNYEYRAICERIENLDVGYLVDLMPWSDAHLEKYRQIDPSATSWTEVKESSEQAYSYYYVWYSKVKELWGKEIIDKVHRIQDTRITHIIRNYCLAFTEELEITVQHDPRGKEIAHRVVPSVGDLPQKLWDNRESVVKSILGIYPEAEQQALLLGLGRTLAGSNHDVALGSKGRHKLDSTYRNLNLSYGDAGIGKSTLFNRLSEVLKEHGYDVVTIQPNMNRFSLSPQAAKASMLYIDDMTDRTLIDWTGANSNLLKSYVTNGTISIEQKYRDPVQLEARGVIFSNANNIPRKAIYQATKDSGFESRLTIMRTKNHSQLTDGKGTHDYHGVWQTVCDEYGVTNDDIALVLLRHGYEYYMSSLGYSKDDSGAFDLATKPKTGLLKKEIDDIRSRLVTQPQSKPNQFVSSVRALTEVAIGQLPEDMRAKLDPAKGVSLDAMTLYHYYGTVVNCIFKGDDDSKALVSLLNLRNSGIDWNTTGEHLEGIMGHNLADNWKFMQPAKAFAEAIGSLTTIEGESLPTARNFYVDMWNDLKDSPLSDELIGITIPSACKPFIKALADRIVKLNGLA